MHKVALRKSDGRPLWLYARDPLPEGLTAPSPSLATHAPNAHLRWHPLRGEWVAYATHRQQRTYLPPTEYNPLAPTVDPGAPTEVPAGPWDVAVFANLFPTLTMGAHDPPALSVPTAAAIGTCEVVVFTQDARASLGQLPLWHLELLIAVWADRYLELGGEDAIKYVFPFENRGVEVGVTLHHPHGQLYAYPFVPPVPAQALEQQRLHYEAHGRGLLEEMIAHELDEKRRVIYSGAHAVAFMPICARYSYEIWVAPLRPATSLAALGGDERKDLARALKTILLKFDGLWNMPFPYILAIYQAPTDGAPHPEAHMHIEIYSAYRMRGRLKYLAGSEIGAGVFTADTVPEDKVKELQAVAVQLDG